MLSSKQSQPNQTTFHTAQNYYNLGITSKICGDLSRARYYFNKCLQTSETYELAYVEIGNLFNIEQKFQQAQIQFRKALTFKKDCYDAILNIAFLCHKNQKRLNQAIEYYQIAMRLKPHDFVSYYNLGKIYKKLKKYQKAEELFLKALQRNINTVKAHFHRGQIKQKQKLYQQAEVCFKNAIQKAPQFIDSYIGLARVYLAGNNFQFAEQCLKSFVKKYPNNPKGYFQLGQLYRFNSKPQEAKLMFKQSIKRNPDDAEAYYRIAYIQFYHKKVYKALEYFLEAVNREKKIAKYRYGLAICYGETGRISEALDQLSYCIEAEPTCQMYVDTKKNYLNIYNQKQIQLDNLEKASYSTQNELQYDDEAFYICKQNKFNTNDEQMQHNNGRTLRIVMNKQ